MSSNQSGPIGAVELLAATAPAGAAEPAETTSVQIDGAHRALHTMVARGGSFSGRERNCAFLNTRDGQFASAASAVGFDFLDDARAVVTLDYDGDGDVDIVTTNRTAPRLRVLLNRSERLAGADRTRSITLRLDGKAAGASVGATVELQLAGERPLVRTTSLGSGFLGASSSVLTIGVGSAVGASAKVTWANGNEEAFGALDAGSAYALTQGTGSAVRYTLPSLTVKSSAESTEAGVDGPYCSDQAVSAFLSTPEPLPKIERRGEAYAWRDLELEPHGLDDGTGRPRVVTLWSLDCPLCSRELQEWQVRGSSFATLALSVDEVIAQAAGEDFDHRLLEDYVTAWPTDGPRDVTFGLATFELLESLQAAVDRPFARDEDLSLPATLVFDGGGQLAAIHRGLVKDAVVAADLAFLDSDAANDPEARRDRAAGFDGRWLAPPPKTSTVAIARAWLDAGAAEAAAEALLRAAARGEFRADTGIVRPASRAAAEAARLLYEKGDFAHAIPVATLTTELRPDWAKGHFNRATMLDAANEVEAAEAAYTKVLSLRANHWQALANRGLLRGRTGRQAEGLADLQRALAALPKSAPPAQRELLTGMLESLK